MTTINVGKGKRVEITYLYGDNQGKKVKGKVVHIFKAFKLPSRKKLFKYYGEDILEPRYGKICGSMKTDRIVIKKKNDKGYIILPLTGWNRFFTLKNISKCAYCGKY